MMQRGTFWLIAMALSFHAAASDTPNAVYELWPDGPPGGVPLGLEQSVVHRSERPEILDRAIVDVTQPTLSLFRPRKANGSAVLIIPGGGYRRVVVDHEGYDLARWLNARGVTALVLLYRLPGDGWRDDPNTPLQDAQRAMRLIREMSDELNVNPQKIGVLGFSAGGHLAASLETRYDEEVYDPVDKADTLPARPDFAGLVYPVISMKAPTAHAGSAERLLGERPGAQQRAAYSAQNRVRPETPPTFLLHAGDDGSVPVENSLLMYAALRKAGVAAEMHLFEQGGHGFGLRNAQQPPLSIWPQQFYDWAASHGFFPQRRPDEGSPPNP